VRGDGSKPEAAADAMAHLGFRLCEGELKFNPPVWVFFVDGRPVVRADPKGKSKVLALDHALLHALSLSFVVLVVDELKHARHGPQPEWKVWWGHP
jgi:hypothetical protein